MNRVMKLKSICFISLASLFLFACVTLQPLSQRQLEWAHSQGFVSDQKLEEGRLIYTSKCGSCHGLIKPKSYSRKKWPATFQKMSHKAKLSEDEKEITWQYVEAALSPEK